MNIYTLVYVYHNSVINTNYVTCRTSANKSKIDEDRYTLYREVLRSECLYRKLFVDEHMVPDQMLMILDNNKVKYKIIKNEDSIELDFDNGDAYYNILVQETKIDI